MISWDNYCFLDSQVPSEVTGALPPFVAGYPIDVGYTPLRAGEVNSKQRHELDLINKSLSKHVKVNPLVTDRDVFTIIVSLHLARLPT